MTNEEKSEKPINPMTNQIVVTTDSTGTKAWTVNPIEKPEHYDLYSKYGSFTQYGESLVADSVKWQQAESERKRYEVENIHHAFNDNVLGTGVFYYCNKHFPHTRFTPIKPNTTYIAEIVDENTVRILKEVV